MLRERGKMQAAATTGPGVTQAEARGVSCGWWRGGTFEGALLGRARLCAPPAHPPASGPRPASSTPATRAKPLCHSSCSSSRVGPPEGVGAGAALALVAEDLSGPAAATPSLASAPAALRCRLRGCSASAADGADAAAATAAAAAADARVRRCGAAIRDLLLPDKPRRSSSKRGRNAEVAIVAGALALRCRHYIGTLFVCALKIRCPIGAGPQRRIEKMGDAALHSRRPGVRTKRHLIQRIT